MKKENIHIENNDADFYKELEVPFKNTKQEVWDNVFENLVNDKEIPQKKEIISLFTVKLLIAASVVILVGITAFMRFYTTEVFSLKGERLSHVLPDGSKIDLNADSKIVYNKYWWNFKREVEFSGEAFFDISKGEKFTIKSENGITEILGTSFNIYARNNKYQVYCKTGKVKVSNLNAKVELIINPGELAAINNKKEKGSIVSIDEETVLAWKNNKFNFISEPIQFVVAELERHYNVKISIQVSDPSSLVYTGYFNRTGSVESSLDLICKSFGLNYSIIQKNVYTIN